MEVQNPDVAGIQSYRKCRYIDKFAWLFLSGKSLKKMETNGKTICHYKWCNICNAHEET